MAVRRRESAGLLLFLKRHLNVKYMFEQSVNDQNYAQMYHSYKSGRSKIGQSDSRASCAATIKAETISQSASN